MQVAFDDYAWAAGVATDLVLTAPGVWHGTDKLADVAELRAFLDEHDLAAVAARDLAGVHTTRTRLRELVDDPDPERLTARASALTAPVGGLGLDGTGRRWTALLPEDAGPGQVLSLVGGLGVLGVLAHLGPERFRPCASDTCSGVFIDTSRPGRRRYCMPGVCGNRANVAAHRARRRGGAAG